MRVLAVALALSCAAVPVSATEVLEGLLSIVWGDPPPGGGPEPDPLVQIVTSDGETVRFEGDRALLDHLVGLGPGALVRVSGRFSTLGTFHGEGMIQLKAGTRMKALMGAQPWVSLMCKFKGTSDPAHRVGYFIDMFDNTPGRLDHYWREVSYQNINVVGSTAVGWVELPKTRTQYESNGWNLTELFDDCTAAADHLVDFSDAGGGEPFVGINLMFNDILDGYAWGGGRPATLDGLWRYWRVTWEPPWGWKNVSVMAHEMGHGFGLPHSNNWEGASDPQGAYYPYDNVWDVMSDSWNYAASDSTYGTIGKHTIGYHKYDRLGWIPSAKVYQPAPDSAAWVEIDDLALPSVAHYQVAKLPIPGTDDFYTVEVRGKTGHYDARLPSKAVIIHHVDPGRSQPAWAVDAAVPPGNNSAGEGTMWRAGETFEDAAAQITVMVDSQTTNGFRLRILYGDASDIFKSGFEPADAPWSDTRP